MYPLEIIVQILSYLPLKDLATAFRVCKKWSTLSTDEELWSMVLINNFEGDYYVDNGDFKLVFYDSKDRREIFGKSILSVYNLETRDISSKHKCSILALFHNLQKRRFMDDIHYFLYSERNCGSPADIKHLPKHIINVPFTLLPLNDILNRNYRLMLLSRYIGAFSNDPRDETHERVAKYLSQCRLNIDTDLMDLIKHWFNSGLYNKIIDTLENTLKTRIFEYLAGDMNDIPYPCNKRYINIYDNYEQTRRELTRRGEEINRRINIDIVKDRFSFFQWGYRLYQRGYVKDPTLSYSCDHCKYKHYQRGEIIKLMMESGIDLFKITDKRSELIIIEINWEQESPRKHRMAYYYQRRKHAKLAFDNPLSLTNYLLADAAWFLSEGRDYLRTIINKIKALT